VGLSPGFQSVGNSCQSYRQSDRNDCSASFGVGDFARVYVKAAADADLSVGTYILLSLNSTRPSRLCLASERFDDPGMPYSLLQHKHLSQCCHNKPVVSGRSGSDNCLLLVYSVLNFLNVRC
jgi:hypothetical protein